MKLTSTKELYNYWNSLRGARSAPERSEIDPVAIRGVLADTFILEVNPIAGYPLRVAGARTSSLFQRELRGRTFLELWQSSSRGEVAELLAFVTDEASPVVGGASANAPGFQSLELEFLLLPLRHRGATHSRILGLCTPAAAPNWLGLAAIGPMTLQSMRVLHRGGTQTMSAAPIDQPSPSQLETIARLIRRGRLQVFSDAEQQS
jgi:hypothetical protein